MLVGAFLPEATDLVEDLLHPYDVHPAPDRSHWVVVHEDLDMLEDPDPDLDSWNYDFYRAEAAGLLYLAGVGVVLAASALFARSRTAAALLALALGEGFAVWRALRRARRARFVAVDVVGLLPASFLSLLGVGLYAYLHGNPQWPTGGYLCVALGGLVAIMGMVMRRVRNPSGGASCSPDALMAGSPPRPSGAP